MYSCLVCSFCDGHIGLFPVMRINGNYHLPFTCTVTNVMKGLLELLFFVDKDRHSSLWLDATAFGKSQMRYLRSYTTTVYSSQWPQSLEIHKISDSGQLANDHIPTGISLNGYFCSPTPLQLILAWVHNIWSEARRM